MLTNLHFSSLFLCICITVGIAHVQQYGKHNAQHLMAHYTDVYDMNPEQFSTNLRTSAFMTCPCCIKHVQGHFYACIHIAGWSMKTCFSLLSSS